MVKTRQIKIPPETGKVFLGAKSCYYAKVNQKFEQYSGSVVECLTLDWGDAGSSLTGVTALCPWARHIYPCLVLVQPRKARSGITEKMLTGT